MRVRVYGSGNLSESKIEDKSKETKRVQIVRGSRIEADCRYTGRADVTFILCTLGVEGYFSESDDSGVEGCVSESNGVGE